MAFAAHTVAHQGAARDGVTAQRHPHQTVMERFERGIVGTIQEDANAFTKRINLGSVGSVSGRVITMVVQKAEVAK
jgi:hypothetical protein